MERFLNPLGLSQVSVWSRAHRKSLEGEAKFGGRLGEPSISFIQVRSVTTGIGYLRLSNSACLFTRNGSWLVMERRQLVAGWPRFPELISELSSCCSKAISVEFVCLFHCPARLTKCQSKWLFLPRSAVSEPAVDDYHGSVARPQPTVLIWTDVRRYNTATLC